MNKLYLVWIDLNYCDYLRTVDKKVPYNFGKKEMSPFVGVLFEMNKVKYFAPLSSPKPKHLKLKQKVDFLKIDNGTLGAINFNNMLPVKDNNIIYIDLNKSIEDASEQKQITLLKKQLFGLIVIKHLYIIKVKSYIYHTFPIH